MSADRVVIVGGGILGTMHALEATNRGWEVLQLEGDAGPRRASVRNFGLIWVSGRAAGEELDLALRARTLWERIASTCPGIGFRPDGSLTVARTDTELSLMAEAASRADASARRTELLDPSGVRDVNPAVKGDVAGGLLCRLDAVVEPGSVLGAVRAGAGGDRSLPVAPRAPGGRGPVLRWTCTWRGRARRNRQQRRAPSGSSSFSCVWATGCPASVVGSEPPWPKRRCAGAGCR